MQILLSLFIGFTSLVGGVDVEPEHTSSSVEIGIAELSPRGEVGGYAIPASGCGSPGGGRHSHGPISCPPPTITADKILVKKGDDVEITWTTGGWPGCDLSDQFGSTNADRSNKTASFTVSGETTYTIDCGAGGVDSVTVYILREIEES